MKTTLETLTVQLEYPCLMISRDGTLVLFYQSKRGTVVHDASGDYAIGEFLDGFNMNVFKPYYGRVVLQND